MAYFSSPVASASSSLVLAMVVAASAVLSTCDEARDARAMACANVFGWGLADGGAVIAEAASEALEALESRVTFSETVRPRSLKDSRILVG
jgi:hypothetical protein